MGPRLISRGALHVQAELAYVVPASMGPRLISRGALSGTSVKTRSPITGFNGAAAD